MMDPETLSFRTAPPLETWAPTTISHSSHAHGLILVTPVPHPSNSGSPVWLFPQSIRTLQFLLFSVETNLFSHQG